MKTVILSRLSLCLLLSGGAWSVARAGDDAPRTSAAVTAPTTGPAAAVPQMKAYLDSQRLNHSIEIVDAKAVAKEHGPIIVKLYGEIDLAQQEIICAALGATARKTRTEGSSVLFFSQDRAPGNPVFQMSVLPSGTAEVFPNRGGAQPGGYKLRRTVRL
jgi:hypothetical protein